MEKITFVHGGPDYDARYPDGIPTSVVITDASGTDHASGMVMYPGGHARNTTAPLRDILAHKFALLSDLAFEDPKPVIARFEGLAAKPAAHIRALHDFEIRIRDGYE